MRPTSTDPGVAPPGPMLPVPDEPMGIVVPSSAAQRLNDSVDVLLEGISREFPDGPYPASQSDGRSTATYHAGHPVRSGVGTPPSDEPKVVIERSQVMKTIRAGRRSAVAVERDAREWTETTMVTAHPMGSRVLIALVAGIAVVVVIFVALERTSNERVVLMKGGPAPASPATIVANAPGPALVATVAALPAVAPPAVDPRPPAPPALVPTSPPGEVSPPALPAMATDTAAHRPASPAPVKPVRPKAKPPASAKPAPTDIGEFKGAF